MGKLRMARAAALCLAVAAAAAGAEDLVAGIDYLNDRMPIPDSVEFDEGAYIESGVGLSFGVDKRLTYLAGEYEEAAQRFEESVRRFRYKAEIWVFLSRAYFGMKSPHRAREALLRAEALMPDLSPRLWRPLVASLEEEIRQRAARQQAQIDFYSTGQEEVLSLFRLYLFLKDHDSARATIAAARQRSQMMRERAQMASGNGRRSYVSQSGKWSQLADGLSGELAALGVEVGPPPTPEPPVPAAVPDDADEQEHIRVLQLRIDFYEAAEADYIDLFALYMARGDSAKARGVVASLSRHIADLGVRASVAPTVTDQVAVEARRDTLRQARDEIQAQLSGPAAGAP